MPASVHQIRIYLYWGREHSYSYSTHILAEPVGRCRATGAARPSKAQLYLPPSIQHETSRFSPQEVCRRRHRPVSAAQQAVLQLQLLPRQQVASPSRMGKDGLRWPSPRRFPPWPSCCPTPAHPIKSARQLGASSPDTGCRRVLDPWAAWLGASCFRRHGVAAAATPAGPFPWPDHRSNFLISATAGATPSDVPAGSPASFASCCRPPPPPVAAFVLPPGPLFRV